METAPGSLISALNAALPGNSDTTKQSPVFTGFEGKIRYIHTPRKPCDPLFSPPPGHDPEKTRLSSHFLTASVGATHTAGSATSISPYLEKQQEGVLGIGIEVLLYSTKHLTTIFVSKADTTGYISPGGISPTKAICTTFVRWLVEQERKTHPGRKVVVSLFARAQSQYLFPGSVEHGGKHVLDDRQLIKWWARVLDPLLDLPRAAEETPAVAGFLTIPGYDKSELRSYLPRTSHANGHTWKPGHPLSELGETRGLPADAPPRALLPRFPDDPKARFIQDLDDEVGLSEDARTTASPSKRRDGRWKSIRDLDRFWEAMEFRQECSSGRVVGFLWVVVAPSASLTLAENGLSQESQQSILPTDGAVETRDLTPTPSVVPSDCSSPTAKKRKRRPLTGPIIPRQPRLKGGSSSLTATSIDLNGMLHTIRGDGLLVTKEGYDKAMHTLLHLDFANLESAARSTSKWVAEVATICGLAGDWAVDVVGTAKNARQSAKEKIELDVSSTSTSNGGAVGLVNDLGSMIRKKRKAPTGTLGDHIEPAKEESPGAEKPAANLLGGGLIRKKPKTAS